MRETILIAVIGKDGGIGCDGNLLWHLPGDLKHFKTLTSGHPVIMGRKTWESLPKRPLPGRRNIVVSRNTEYVAEGAEVFPSIEIALHTIIDGKAFIMGGGTLYNAAIDYADTLELTEVDATAPADTFFPEIDLEKWERIEYEKAEEKGISYRFVRYRAKR